MRFTSWDECLCHHGIKGQKWGVRRYQNPDGTLTDHGKKRGAYKRASKERDKALAPLYSEDKKLLREYSKKVLNEVHEGSLKPGDKGYEEELNFITNYPITIDQAKMYMKDINPRLEERFNKAWDQYKDYRLAEIQAESDQWLKDMRAKHARAMIKDSKTIR